MRQRRGIRPSVGLLFLLAILACLWTGSARLDAAVLKNDSVVDFSQVAIQAGFVANERAAAWLTSTCNGTLTAVQVLWMSTTGGSGQTLGDSITISEAGTFPNPGSQIAQLVGPALNDGFFNEFPVVPEIPITIGETVVVDFRFFEAPPSSGPSVVTDQDGCQASKNGIFAIPPSLWLDSCILGVGGDFAIRAVVQCTGVIFEDGFESGDSAAWSSQIP
ncbi:MAG: hypothetical protein WBP10_04705 [Thermoanaerobaculia bacterium]|jgi:hypothetical protein